MNDAKIDLVLGAFNSFLEKCIKELEENGLEWVVIGSLASYLQGCDIIPNDVDIVPKTPETVQFICNFMNDFMLKEKSKADTIDKEKEEELWFSSKEKPIDQSIDEWGFEWVFARWLINEIKVEIAHITPPDGFREKSEGIWEAGPEIWSYIRKVPYRNYQIPVVPLEIQLETNLERKLEGRVKEIISILNKEGCNKEILEKAINKKNRNSIANLLKVFKKF